MYETKWKELVQQLPSFQAHSSPCWLTHDGKKGTHTRMGKFVAG